MGGGQVLGNSMWTLFDNFSRFWGARRRFVRRFAGLALLLLGIHLAADRLDDLVFFMFDRVDLWVDGWTWSLLSWASEQQLVSTEESVRYAQQMAEAVDVGAKDRASKWCALFMEWAFAIWLLDFAWGKRLSVAKNEELGGPQTRFLQSIAELRSGLRHLDLERLVVLPVLLGLSCAGALDAAIAVEAFTADLLTSWAPAWRQGIALAAVIGLLSASLLIWRITPDILQGALLRSQERGEAKSRGLGTNASVWSILRVRLRGLAFAACAVPLTWLSLAGQDAFVGLVSRIGAHL